MTRRLLIEARVEAERVLLALDAALAKRRRAAASRRDAQAIDGGARRASRRAVAGDDRDSINGGDRGAGDGGQPFAERRMDRAIREALSGRSLDEIEASVAMTPCPRRRPRARADLRRAGGDAEDDVHQNRRHAQRSRGAARPVGAGDRPSQPHRPRGRLRGLARLLDLPCRSSIPNGTTCWSRQARTRRTCSISPSA